MKGTKNLVLTFILSILIGALSASEPESPFQFAWFSDMHIGSPTAAEDLRRTVADVNTEDVDFTIISGDITELDINGYLDTAKVILDELLAPYYIIPGNHDTKWSSSGTRKFIDLWGADKFNFEYENIRFIGIHQGPLMRMGDGYIAPEDLHWLDSTLTNLLEPNQAIILVTHYPLDSTVSNWYQYLDIIKNHNAQMILHGHGHHNRASNYEGVPGLMGRSTLRHEELVGGYNIVTVWPDSAVFTERTPGLETQPAWHVQSLGKRTYPDTIRFRRPDFSINDAYPKVQVRWSYDTGYAITSAAVVSGTTTIIADGGGNITRLNTETGIILWSQQINAPIYSTPAIAENQVVVSATDSNIYSFAIKDGSLLWQVKTNAPVVASPVIYRQIVYCGSSDGIFRAIDLHTGQLQWNYEGINGFVETTPLIHKKKVVFGAWDGYLYALNAKTGRLKWKWNDGLEGVLYSPAACIPVASGNKIYIVAPDRVMSCINARNGKTIWREDRYQVRESIGISEDRKTLFAKTMRDTLVAYNAKSRKPQLKWAVHVGFGYDIDPSRPIENNGRIFFGTKDGFIYALDAVTGSVQWHYRVGVGLVNNLTVITANSIIATTMDGNVVHLYNAKQD
ncbi:MAG: PQQ-binding-like beta-propeller repeat protein [Candidatus Marinimicrobia bacterium]|nr:PQQ-binding-like beta-propeller repeat protein [Candidatus Neomarinimicrobiota bacterium]